MTIFKNGALNKDIKCKRKIFRKSSELLHELPNNVRHKMLGNQEMLRRSQIFIELWPSSQSSSENENFVNTCKKLFKN